MFIVVDVLGLSVNECMGKKEGESVSVCTHVRLCMSM